jgi:hypothetical protein
MVQVAVEQHEPEAQRLVQDELACRCLPSGLQHVVRLTHWRPLRRLVYRLSEKRAPGVRGGVLCRKRYIDDKDVEAANSQVYLQGYAQVSLGDGIPLIGIPVSSLRAGTRARPASRAPPKQQRRYTDRDLRSTRFGRSTAFGAPARARVAGQVPRHCRNQVRNRGRVPS